MRKFLIRFSMATLFCVINTAASLALDTIILEPSQDNTLYETALDNGDQQFEVSNGAGSYLFAGRTGVDADFKLRRALLQFDLLSSLPTDVEIVFAQLTVYQSKAAPDSPAVSMGLHRVLQAWGEGASNAFGAEGQGNWAESGDATWHHRIFPDVLWDTAGGNFASTASAEVIVDELLEHYTWSCNDALLADLNYWLNNPEMNFGWLIAGGEAANQSAHRFNSRENSMVENRPKLTLVYRKKDDIFVDSFEQFLSCQ